MNPKEFISFLNGAIELGNITSLNIKNFEIINDKVNSVANDNTPEGMFCTWLKGFLEASDNSIINETQFIKISKKLSGLSGEIIIESSSKNRQQQIFNQKINQNDVRLKC